MKETSIFGAKNYSNSVKRMKPLFILALSITLCACQSTSNTPQTSTDQPIKNVIFLIGDGMGLSQLYAAMMASEQPMAISRAPYVGLQVTRSATSDVTDSAAAGTALATGTKTRNGSIGVDSLGHPLRSILQRAETAGLSTGLIATHSVTDATPAAFVAHNPDRAQEEAIAEDFLTSDVDLFIGGGRQRFEHRTDGRNLSNELRNKGYHIFYTLDSLPSFEQGPIGVLLADDKLPSMQQGRGDLLPRATQEAVRLLSKNTEHGFFLMIEGSQIDVAAHHNDADAMIQEILDFDHAVRIAMDFADTHPGTLVLVTADHETGGVTLPSDSNIIKFGKAQPTEGNRAQTRFSTKGHTASMVPIYAYGAGAEQFTGLLDNTDLPHRIAHLLQLPQ